MNYLLDTHVFLWLLGDPDRIAEAALRDLANTDNRLVVSAVSAWEVATKVRLGKLESARNLAGTWSARVRDIGGEDLAITPAHALLAGSILWRHRDPFDRLLVAQALADNLTLVSNDGAMNDVVGLSVRTC